MQNSLREVAVSYLMGAEDISDQELTVLGIKIHKKKESGSRLLLVPCISFEAYENLIKEKLTPGFWNEYITADSIVFLFVHKDGSYERIIFDQSSQDRIARLCSSFSGDDYGKTKNVLAYLEENDFYIQMIRMFHKQVEFGTVHADAEYRPSVAGIFFDIAYEKIIVLQWKKFAWQSLVMGGIDTGETPVEAMRREMIEETGFTDFTILESLGRPITSNYYADNKKKWRRAEFHVFYGKLNTLEQQQRNKEEESNFDIEFKKPDELRLWALRQEVNKKHDFRPLAEMIDRLIFAVSYLQ